MRPSIVTYLFLLASFCFVATGSYGVECLIENQKTTCAGDSCRYDMFPSWSPDEEDIVFHRDDSNGNKDIWKVDLATEGVSMVGGCSSQPNRDNGGPCYYPGPYIVFHAKDTSNNFDIWITDLSNSFCSNLTNTPPPQNERSPKWSPDGAWIAFHVEETGHIYKMPSGGGIPIQITTQGTNAEVTWSPDGSMIAYQSDRSGNWDIWRCPAVAAGDTAAVQLTTCAAYDGRPAWHPNGLWIAYETDCAPGGIVLTGLSGGGTVPLTSDGTDSDPCWSPSGDRIAFSREKTGVVREIWIADCDDFSGVPTIDDERPATWGTIKSIYR